MIYDITDIINDTHQFPRLIEGGGGLQRKATALRMCKHPYALAPAHSTHPQVTCPPPFLPAFLLPFISLSFTLECYGGDEVSSSRRQRRLIPVRELCVNSGQLDSCFHMNLCIRTHRSLVCAYVCAHEDFIMATMSVCRYTVIYDS